MYVELNMVTAGAACAETHGGRQCLVHPAGGPLQEPD